MKLRLIAFLLASIFLFSMTPAIAEEMKPLESLPPLIAAAIANNPELKASDARWRMFTSRVKQVSSLDDPMLMLKISNGVVRAPLDFQKETMTGRVIGLSQQLPFWGKRGLKGEVAAKEAESYRWSLEERKLELRRMVIEAYYQLYFVDRSMEITDRNIRILDDFIVLSETKYAVGQGAQQDVFKAQVERSKLLDMRITLEQQRRSLQANLNTLLYRPADTPVGRVPDFDITPVNHSLAELISMAEEHSPAIKGYKALIEKGQAGRKLAEKEYYPDFNLSLEYMQRDPAMGQEGWDTYSLGVTFNLPVQRERREAMAAESSSETAMATEELNNLRNSINYRATDFVAQMERRRKLIELYKNGIIPQAQQSLESAAIGYRVNKVDFLTLLDSRLTLFNYEREYYDSLADYQMKRAQLETMVGEEIK